MKNVGKRYGLSENGIAYYFKKYGLKSKDASIAHRKYVLNQSYFETIDSEEKAYWLGFLYADGNVYVNKEQKQNVVTLSLKNTDKEHVNKFRSAIQSDAIIRDCDHGMVTLKITSEKMTSDLIRIGCVPNKTFKVTFPSEEVIPKHLQRHFIRGIFDGDGCISLIKERNRDIHHIDFQILGTENLVNNIGKIFLREQVILKEPKITKIKNIYKIRLSGVYNALSIMDYLYKDSTVYMQRKLDIFERIKNIKTNNNHFQRKISNNEKKCAVCGDLNCNKYLICHVPGEYYDKILCSRHYNQMIKYGIITNSQKYRKYKCLNNGMIFNTATEAARWCGLKTSSGIYNCVKGIHSYSGKDPVTGEKLKWEEYYE